MFTKYNPDEIENAPVEPTQAVKWAQEQLNARVWGTIKEAAAMVGKHHKTVYRLIETNNPHIAYRITDSGTIVYIPSVFAWYHKEFPNVRPTSK